MIVHKVQTLGWLQKPTLQSEKSSTKILLNTPTEKIFTQMSKKSFFQSDFADMSSSFIFPLSYLYGFSSFVSTDSLSFHTLPVFLALFSHCPALCRTGKARESYFCSYIAISVPVGTSRTAEQCLLKSLLLWPFRKINTNM